jgi:hypothetical protein
VKICDAYGAGFFYIPGTDTCLRVGGMVLADWQVSNTPDRFGAPGATSVGQVNNGQSGTGNIAVAGAYGGGGALPTGYVPGKNRDAVASLALGRLELDARTQSPWGTVRAFMRVDSVFGSGQVSATGASLSAAYGLPAYTPYSTYAEGRETTTLNKAFLQFAGITMGRIQSMFDFYADAVGYTAMRGSNQTANAIAYTLTMGGGFSATLSVEDSVSHRQAPSSVVGLNNAWIGNAPLWTQSVGGALAANSTIGAPTSQLNGTRLPDIVANLRLDQPWGSAQIMGAVHQIRAGLYALGGAAAGGIIPGLNFAGGSPNNLVATGLGNFANTNQIGFAIGGGLKFNLDMLAPGDVLWLQAIYAKGAVGYLTGSNLAYVNGVNSSNGYGVGLARISSGNGWNGSGIGDTDCVWTMMGTCDKSSGLAITAALRHYWTPTISSTLAGSMMKIVYSANSLNPAIGASMTNQIVASGSNSQNLAFLTGQTNFTEFRMSTGLEWNPVRGFGIGAEVEWEHGVTSRPVGLASDLVLAANGLPAFKSQADLVRGRVRMYRAF